MLLGGDEKEGGPLGLWGRGEGSGARALEPGADEEAREGWPLEAWVLLTHLGLEVRAVVAEQVEDDGATSGLEDAGHLGDDGSRVGDVGEDEEQEGAVAGMPSARGSDSRLPLRSSTLGRPCVRRAAASSMASRLVDADDAEDVGRQGRGHRSGAASQVGEGPVLGQRGRAAPARQRPCRTSPRADGPTVSAAVAKKPCDRGLSSPQAGSEAQIVLRRCGPPTCLGTSDVPELPEDGVAVDGHHPVEARCALGAAPNETAVREHLEVTADRGLGELEDLDELGHTQLVGLEETEETEASRIGETLHARQQTGGRSLLHPYIRMEGYMDAALGQGSALTTDGTSPTL